MRCLDTRALEQLGRRPRAARARRFVWLVWMRPHFRTGEYRRALRTDVRWPVYLEHGTAA